jgi:hypothetical protein
MDSYSAELGTDSGGCEPALENWTQGKVTMTEVGHFRQEECIVMPESTSFRFPPFRFLIKEPDRYIPVK